MFSVYLLSYLHGKVEGHELTDGLKTAHGGTDGETGEAHLGDRRINDTLGAKLVKEALGHLYKKKK